MNRFKNDPDLAEAGAELKTDIQKVGSDLTVHRAETAAGFAQVRSDVSELKRDFEIHRVAFDAFKAETEAEFAEMNAKLDKVIALLSGEK